ncbi:MAG: hypothetical protein IPM64_11455 [Phycisphaerales bacterium]|nr:hypothetical protein [Phycisphaerales bacterium]
MRKCIHNQPHDPSPYAIQIEDRHDDNVILRTTRGFESGAGARDLIDFVANDWVVSGSPETLTPISMYDYTNDDLARRTGVDHTGAAFSASQELSHGYNERNELTQTDREVSGEFLRRWSYAYDAIGNRLQHLLTEDPEGLDEVIVANGGYQRNSLNQYTNVNELRADSNTTAVSHAHDADGNLVSVTAVSGDMDCRGTLTNFDIDVFVDAIIEGPPFTDYYTAYPTCDHLNGDVNGDGYLNNLDIDLFVGLVVGNGNSARTTLTWDAENRLRSFGPTAGSEAEGMTRVEFRYDYMGRRVEKAVYEWDATGESGSWVTQSRTRFVYDGWNLIQELNVPTAGDPTVLRQYTWGLDLSGQNGNSTVGGLHGAGGIGGLLSVYDTNGTTTGEYATSDDKSYVFLYDANGNVGQLVEWASGAGGSSGMAWATGRVAAKYEYDPYGNIVGPDADNDGNIAEEAGTYAAINPFRFSTKFLDPETGLYYYGYRYYSPRLGRWINRDPIEERGGPNVFASLGNEPTAAIDALGHCAAASQPANDERDKAEACRKVLAANVKANQDLIDLLKKKGCSVSIRCAIGLDMPAGVNCVYGAGAIICFDTHTAAELRHELIHALQYCGVPGMDDHTMGPPSPTSVDDRACMELQAYTCSGQCGKKTLDPAAAVADPPNLQDLCILNGCVRSVRAATGIDENAAMRACHRASQRGCSKCDPSW